MKTTSAEILNEFGPFPGAERVNGVTFDGANIWFASNEKLTAFDPENGKIERSFDAPAYAGTAFDGRHIYQVSEGKIHTINPATGAILATIDAPPGGKHSGMAWADGSLWVAQYDDRKIHQVDPKSGAVLRTIESTRHVTGVTWVDGQLWHGTWEDDDTSDIRRIDPKSGEALESIEMPAGKGVSGLESDGKDRFFAGGGATGKVRVIRRPAKATQ
jgi:streptogramin lyase